MTELRFLSIFTYVKTKQEVTNDDVKTMPDVWADSHPSSKLAHYKPWPCCYYGPNYSITGDQWTKVELHGLKFYKDIDDLNKNLSV